MSSRGFSADCGRTLGTGRARQTRLACPTCDKGPGAPFRAFLAPEVLPGGAAVLACGSCDYVEPVSHARPDPTRSLHPDADPRVRAALGKPPLPPPGAAPVRQSDTRRRWAGGVVELSGPTAPRNLAAPLEALPPGRSVAARPAPRRVVVADRARQLVLFPEL